MSADFEQWLCGRLAQLKVDGDVFTSYIQGILEGDDGCDEKTESIEGILSDACSDTELVRSTTAAILHKFAEFAGDTETSTTTVSPTPAASAAFEDTVKSIFSHQDAKATECAEKKKAGAVSQDEDVKTVRSTILSQYSQVEVDLDEAAETSGDNVIKASNLAKEHASVKKSDPEGTSVPKEKRKDAPLKEPDPLLMKNTNAQKVLEAEKLKREKSKQEAEARKVKDKNDRENQKKKEIERKEKEKQRTQKGERRR